jgi:hypothetical protein
MNAIYARVAQDLPDASSQDITADLSLWKTQWTGTKASGMPITADDRAARYMPWMALGGTSVQIPQELLEIVAVTKVLGASRVVPQSSLSANMLSQAKALCLNLIGPPYSDVHQGRVPFDSSAGYLGSPKLTSNFILTNGDAELWMRLCTIGNAPPVHILTYDGGTLVASTQDASIKLNIGPENASVTNGGSLVDAATWLRVAPSAPVGNEHGGLDPSLVVPTATNVLPGATAPGNLWPWCIDPTPPNSFSTSPVPPALQAYECPAAVLQISHSCGAGNQPSEGTCFWSCPDAAGSCGGQDQVNPWAIHGAVNAGMAVFLYAQSVVKAGQRDKDYDECPP